MPQSVVCVPTRDAEGTWLNPWGEDNNRTRLDPSRRPTKDTAVDGASQGKPAVQLRG